MPFIRLSILVLAAFIFTVPVKAQSFSLEKILELADPGAQEEQIEPVDKVEVPIPPRKPETLTRAAPQPMPPSDVAASRIRPEMLEVQNPLSDGDLLYKIRRNTARNMPASPSGSVVAESLSSPTPPPDHPRLIFRPGQEELLPEMQRVLDRDVANILRDSPATGLQILSYATSAADEGQSAARRLSLARALAVRKFLMERGLDSRHIAIRALGSDVREGPPDRVDLVFNR